MWILEGYLADYAKLKERKTGDSVGGGADTAEETAASSNA